MTGCRINVWGNPNGQDFKQHGSKEKEGKPCRICLKEVQPRMKTPFRQVYCGEGVFSANVGICGRREKKPENENEKMMERIRTENKLILDRIWIDQKIRLTYG